MLQHQRHVPTLEAALLLARNILVRNAEVSIVPAAEGGYLVRMPYSAPAADSSTFVPVDVPFLSEAALRSLIATVDEMRTSGTDPHIVDTVNDGPDHWFGGFVNFAVNFESDFVALSWPNLSIVANEGRAILDAK
jgi:hypothetical protein